MATEHFVTFVLRHYWYHILTLVLWRTPLHYRGTVLWNMLSSRYTDLANTSLCNLVKKLKTSDLFKAAKFIITYYLTYYQPQLLVLKMTILYIIEIKLVFLCLIDIYCKSSFYLHFNY